MTAFAQTHAELEEDPLGLVVDSGQSVQDTAPSLSLNVLAGHCSHSALTPSGPYVPFSHFLHPLEPAALVRPLPHAAQSPNEALPVPATEVPAGQSMHRASPISSA